MLGQRRAVALVDRAAVLDARRLGHLVADVVCQPLANGGVDVLHLVGGGHLARADGPDGLVRDHHLRPPAAVFLVIDLVRNRLQLREDDVQRVPLLALRQPGYSPPRLDISPPITLPRLVPSHGKPLAHARDGPSAYVYLGVIWSHAPQDIVRQRGVRSRVGLWRALSG
eukprot:CAMPEP_0181392774 /NCGR_PEP_ID=MMETSP1106-20121128/26781_1 /TAXON_ID=81844 /ORGANISM="Mantoniella antarctica, Strain SL-175" /LENGTH=168 /DNA_ID=CAMNT_0023513941 /DNA_START=169 /DNA_END=675 /DNA_ORIENTATION=+